MFTFVANLKPFTWHRGRGIRRFDAYLISVDYLREHSSLVKKVIRAHKTLVADNGNVRGIQLLLSQYEAEAASLDAIRKEEEESLGRYARPRELSNPLIERFQKLANDIAVSSAKLTDEEKVPSVIEAQYSSRPTYIVGMEDLTIPVLTGLNLEPEYTSLPQAWYGTLTDRAIAFALDTRNGKYGDCHTAVFAGLHGIDYDTSFQAGKMAGAAGISGFTAGLVGALKDKNYIDFRLENGVVIDLGKSIPRPYLRIMEIVSGLHEGYVAATGRKPKFHALGVGTPILLPLIALMGDNNTYTSTDSTAPIKDAYASATICLYVTEPAPLKLKAHRIAEYWLSEGIEWRCPCPYCRKIDGKYPPNLAKAREWWSSEGSRRLSPSDMRDESPLSEYLPLLSSPADDNIRKEVGMARIGHNHWVLQKIEAGIRKHAQDTVLLRDYVAKVVDSYMNASSGESWKQATYAAWQLADRIAQRIEKAEPSGPLPSNK